MVSLDEQKAFEYKQSTIGLIKTKQIQFLQKGFSKGATDADEGDITIAKVSLEDIRNAIAGKSSSKGANLVIDNNNDF